MIKSKLTGLGTPPFVTQVMVGTVANNLTALGSTQAGALQMSLDDIQVFTTVAAGTGAIFSPGTTSAASSYSSGDEMMVVNHGANALLVYPATGGAIANGSANAGFSVPVTKTAYFVYLGSNNWAASVSA
jgi:hypothetical protein